MSLKNEEQTAQVLGCSKALLRKWRVGKEGPAHVKIGRLVRYREDDLTAFVSACRIAIPQRKEAA
jgi:hypothetical protein